jgi:uncharacterized protein (UPF0332 family)
VAVLNPGHLIDQAEQLLITKNSRGQVRQSERRRAISAAYYAVFHTVLTALADKIVGRGERAASNYALVYRSVDHGRLEALCKSVSKGKPDSKSKLVPFVSDGGFGTNLRQFALLAIDLKEKRNEADYDPAKWVNLEDARTAIRSARSAIGHFATIPVDEKRLFLLLLAFTPR